MGIKYRNICKWQRTWWFPNCKNWSTKKKKKLCAYDVYMSLSDFWVVVFQEIRHLLHWTGVPESHIPLAGWKWQPKPRKQQYDSLLFFIIFIFIKLNTSAIHARYSVLYFTVYCSWFANVCRLVCLLVEHMLFKNFHENPACLKIFRWLWG